MKPEHNNEPEFDWENVTFSTVPVPNEILDNLVPIPRQYLIEKMEQMRRYFDQKILDSMFKPITIPPLSWETPKADIPYRVLFDFSPRISDRRMLLSSACYDSQPSWKAPAPPNRFIEYDASDRAWMEPLGMGHWE